MSTDPPEEKPEVPETDHPVEEFIEENLEWLSFLFEEDIRWRIRRGLELAMVAVLIVGLVYWAALFFVLNGG